MRRVGWHPTPVTAANTWTGRSRSRPDTRCGSRPPNTTPSRTSLSDAAEHPTQRPRGLGRSPPIRRKRSANRPAPTLWPRRRVAPTTRAAPKRAPLVRLRCTSASLDTAPDWMAITTASPANRRGKHRPGDVDHLRANAKRDSREATVGDQKRAGTAGRQQGDLLEVNGRQPGQYRLVDFYGVPEGAVRGRHGSRRVHQRPAYSPNHRGFDPCLASAAYASTVPEDHSTGKQVAPQALWCSTGVDDDVRSVLGSRAMSSARRNPS